MKKELKAFTLIELLIVIVLIGISTMLLLSTIFKARKVIIANQTIKSLLLELRVNRRQSMLLRRSSNDNRWVHGIGMRITKSEFATVRYFSPSGGTDYDYYKAYPSGDINQSNLEILGTPYKINNVAKPSFKLAETCNGTLMIIFEALKGTPKYYCNNRLIPSTSATITVQNSVNKLVVEVNGNILLKSNTPSRVTTNHINTPAVTNAAYDYEKKIITNLIQ